MLGIYIGAEGDHTFGLADIARFESSSVLVLSSGTTSGSSSGY
jgi:hypothetical protein